MWTLMAAGALGSRRAPSLLASYCHCARTRSRQTLRATLHHDLFIYLFIRKTAVIAEDKRVPGRAVLPELPVSKRLAALQPSASPSP